MLLVRNLGENHLAPGFHTIAVVGAFVASKHNQGHKPGYRYLNASKGRGYYKLVDAEPGTVTTFYVSLTCVVGPQKGMIQGDQHDSAQKL